MKKRFLAALVCVCMVLVLLPVTALAAPPPAPTNSATWDFTSVTEDGNGAGWAWVQSSKTLTLTDFTFATTAANALKVPANTTIVLEGVNVIMSIHSSALAVSCGLSGLDGSVTITSSSGGSLHVTGGTSTDNYSCGIYSNNLTVSGSADVKATGGMSSQGSSNGIFMWSDSILEIKDNANLTAVGIAGLTSLGITTAADTSITISDNANVAAIGNDNGLKLLSGSTLSITGGTLALTGDVRAISEDYTVPNGYYYRVSAVKSNTTGDIRDTSDGSFVISSLYKYARLTVSSTSAPVNAATPVINTQPSGGSMMVGATHALSVAATSPDSGTLTYQWYKNTSATNSGGTLISGETNATYAAPIDTEGTYYYYVVVTNTITNNGDGGTKTAVTSSGAVTLTITLTAPTTYALTVNGSFAGISGASSYASGTSVSIDAGTRSGYTFSGWTVTGNIVTLADSTSTTTTFTMPASAVTVTANWAPNGSSSTTPPSTGNTSTTTEKTEDKDDADDADDADDTGDTGSTTPTAIEDIFSDINAGDWFYEYVEWALERGLFKGTSETTFSPNGKMTRGMAFMVLARLAGQDVEGAEPWYSLALDWGVENGLTDGSDPDGNITREQLITLLWRYSGSPDADAALDFSDAADVSDWAAQAMAWAVSAGIIQGNDNGTLNPLGEATRAEVAAIFMRFAAIG